MCFCILYIHVCVCMYMRKPRLCVCVCVKVTHPMLVTPLLNCPFLFLLHTSPVCYFWALLAVLILSSESHTYTYTLTTTCKAHWECFRRVRGDVHLLWCAGTIADSLEQTEISRVTRKVKNIILHKMVKGPDHVNATVALPYKGMYTHTHT